MTVDPEGVVLVTRPSQIEALGNPLRARILRLASRPITVAELADELDVPTTRLYYHVNRLVEEGFLQAVEERRSGARTEKIYLRTGSDVRLGDELITAMGDRRKAAEAAATVLFDLTRAEAEAALERIFAGQEIAAAITRAVAGLPAEDAKRFVDRLGDLVRDFRAAGKPGGPQSYSLTVALVPIETKGADR